ncbi:MAG: hypothetical protein ACOY0T_05770 [Myxococcota bacterium]
MKPRTLRAPASCTLARPQITVFGMGAAVALLISAPAHAFVPTPVGGHPGELDLELRFTAERGKLEPTENKASWVKVRRFDEYKLAAGYTFGDVGPLQFVSLRLEGTYYRSPAEQNDPGKWLVLPPGSNTSEVAFAGECAHGATYLGNGVCRFYPADRGGIVSASLSFALIHDPRFALGFFFKSSVPIGMDLQKFQNPRLDYFAFGSNVGLQLTSYLSYESIIFLGLGTHPLSSHHNGVVALTNLFHLHARRWLLPWRAGVKFGPYVEGDITERTDARYDAAYGPIELEQPGVEARQHRDRVRQARFATALLPYFLVTERFALEAGYIQKFFGYDARATQAYYLGGRVIFDLR